MAEELASKFNIGCVIQYYSDQWSFRARKIMKHLPIPERIRSSFRGAKTSTMSFLMTC